MLLKEMMTTGVETMAPNASLSDAARRMKEKDIGLLAIAEDDNVFGVLTDRDIVIRGLAEDMDPTATDVTEVMSEQALSMSQSTPVEEAVNAMEAQQVRRILVADEAHQLVGVISLGDLATRGGQQMAGEVVQKVADA